MLVVVVVSFCVTCIKRIMSPQSSKHQRDVMAGTGAATLSSRYEHAVFFEGIGV